MSSLKEKAKTLVQIMKQNCPVLFQICKNCTGQCEFEGTKSFAGKWVRLEDAQKEIEELKQKLQQWMKEYEEICQDSETDYVRRCSFLEEKFEELLRKR